MGILEKKRWNIRENWLEKAEGKFRELATQVHLPGLRINMPACVF